MPGADRFPLDLLLEPPADVLQRLLTGWLGLPRSARPRPPSMPLPDALARALTTLAGWPGFFRQNLLASVETVAPVDGLGRFLVEPQGNCAWGFSLADADLPDPRVWIDDVIDGRRVADPRTSRFLLKMTLLEIVLGGCDLEASPVSPDPGHGAEPAGGPGPVDALTADDLVADLTRLVALGPLTWPTTCWFYAGPNELAMTMDGISGRREWGWRAGRPGVPAAR
ncbi:MAG TPA: hypothetical protein VH440_06630 [Candidatus Limnocylindrales bacterium]